jgi:hypothetical protein
MTDRAARLSGDLLIMPVLGGHDIAVSLSRDCTIVLYTSSAFGPRGVEHSYTLDIVLNHTPVFLGRGFKIAQTDHHKDEDS